MFKAIRSRAPLRLGLAGGGTDVSPYPEMYGGAILNYTINLYSNVILKPTLNGYSAVAADLGVIYKSESGQIDQNNCSLKLHAEVHKFFTNIHAGGNQLNCDVITYSDAPPGSGLGTSSTLVVALVKAYGEWLKLNLNKYDIAEIAYDIERIRLRLAGGKQDQYAASFGGLNYMEFGKDLSTVKKVKIDQSFNSELESSIVLYHTGASRDSSEIIRHQINAASSEDAQVVNALHFIKQDAVSMKDVLMASDINSVINILRSSWNQKKLLSNHVSNTRIESIYNYALSNGAICGKVSGAGGGGVFMFIVHPENRVQLVKSLAKLEDGNLINFKFTHDGAASWQSFYEK